MDVFSVEIWLFNSSTNTKDLIFIKQWIKITYLAWTSSAYFFTMSHSDNDAHFIREISSLVQFDDDNSASCMSAKFRTHGYSWSALFEEFLLLIFPLNLQMNFFTYESVLLILTQQDILSSSVSSIL